MRTTLYEAFLFSEARNTVAIDQTVDLDARLTEGTFTRGMIFEFGKVVLVVDADHGESFAFLRASEDGANADGQAVVIADRFDGGFGGIARGDRCREDENVLADDHGRDIIAEDHLAAAGIFGRYDVDGAVRVHVHIARFGQLACHASAHNLRTVQTENGVNDLIGGNLIAKELCAGARFGESVFGHREINIVIQMAVAGREMTLCHAQGKVSVLAGNLIKLDCHIKTPFLRRRRYDEIVVAVIAFGIVPYTAARV